MQNHHKIYRLLLVTLFLLGCNAQKNLKQQSPGEEVFPVTSFQVEFDSLLNTPIRVAGDLDVLTATKQENYPARIIAFVEKNKPLFKLKDPDLELKQIQVTTDELGFTHLTFQRLVNAVPIWGDELKFHLNAEKRLYLYNGRYHPSLPSDFKVNPRITQEQAAQIVKDDATRTNQANKIRENELIVYPFQNEIKLSYRINIVGGALKVINWDYFIDSDSGKILNKVNKIQHLPIKN